MPFAHITLVWDNIHLLQLAGSFIRADLKFLGRSHFQTSDLVFFVFLFGREYRKNSYYCHPKL